MIKQLGLCTAHQRGIVASAGLHLFFVGLLYCIQRAPGGASNRDGHTYMIALKANQPLNVSETQVDASAIPEAITPIDQPVKIDKKKAIGAQKQKQAPIGSAKAAAASRHKVETIDTRGLYHAGDPKTTGMTLELPGWKWDTAPNPQDTTEECGKIVFEIKVDAHGEIISIQTIEKTVTPMVEKIYEEALRGLTFSKTSDIHTYYSISTGKVSFILVAR